MLSISGVLGPIYAAILFASGGGYYTIISFAALMAMVSFIIFFFTNRRVKYDTEEITPSLEIVLESDREQDRDCT
jgi:cyanate permease